MYHTLRNALPIVAAALGRKFGVEVGVGGHEARTDGRHIQIPDVPDDTGSRDLAWGYLAHEAAHVRYTDFVVYEQAAREEPLQAVLQNRIEDVRIERALAHPYPGTRTTIATVLGRMLGEGRLSAPESTDHPAQVLAAYLLLALRQEVLGQDVLEVEAHTAAETLRQVFPAAFIARLRTLMDEVPGLANTEESVDLARRIRRLIEEEVNHPPQDVAGRNDGSDTEDSTSQGSGADSDQGDGASSEEGTTGQPATGSRDPGEDGRDPQGSASAQPDAVDGPDSPDASRPGDGVGCVPPRDADGSAQRDALAAVLSAGAGDCGGDLFSEVGKLLGTPPCATNEIRLPLPEDFGGNASPGCACWPGSRRNRRG
jgi:cobaltochelatase CobT